MPSRFENKSVNNMLVGHLEALLDDIYSSSTMININWLEKN